MDDVRYLLEVTNELKLREQRVLLAERTLEGLEQRLRNLWSKSSGRISDVAMLMMQEQSRKALDRSRQRASEQLAEAQNELKRARQRLVEIQGEAT